MAFWRQHMPAGMYLRSAADWHLDPAGVCTIERFLGSQGLTPSDAEPLSLQRYLEYADWFQVQKGLHPVDDRVTALHHAGGTRARFRAEMASGAVVTAEAVLLALGFRILRSCARRYREQASRWTLGAHVRSRESRAFERRRCLVLGGRQSAFEWAALLNEAGAASVHVVHRHDSPRFAEADWSWVGPLVERFEDEPGWYRSLPGRARRAGLQALVRGPPEGRALARGAVPQPSESRSGRGPRSPQPVRVRVARSRCDFDNGKAEAFDQIVLATGYKADLTSVPFLPGGTSCRCGF